MQYCQHCQVHIRGNKSECPLCNNLLPPPPENTSSDESFPRIPPTYERHLAVRIMLFISVTAIVISFVADYFIPSSIYWPLWIFFGLFSMWISLVVVIRKRHHITKNIMWQVTIVSLLSVVWDWATGWSGWSLDFVLPVIYVAAMLVMYVSAKIMRLSIRDYITYLLLDGLFGIIPVIFILFNWVSFVYPSMICVAVSLIFLSAILIFQGDNIRIELNKRMHL